MILNIEESSVFLLDTIVPKYGVNVFFYQNSKKFISLFVTFHDKIISYFQKYPDMVMIFENTVSLFYQISYGNWRKKFSTYVRLRLTMKVNMLHYLVRGI